jgi:MarR family 2-MHQ and catechol resistance regulon transcriptional repressor
MAMRKRYKGSKEEVRALSAYVKLMRATESVTSRTLSHLADAGLTVSQFGALEALYHLGPMTQKEIAKKILKSTGNITMVIDNLEKRELVRRERDSDDRRSFIIHLTDNGYALIDEIFPNHAELITKEFGVLTKTEQEQLARLCKKLGMGIGGNK